MDWPRLVSAGKKSMKKSVKTSTQKVVMFFFLLLSFQTEILTRQGCHYILNHLFSTPEANFWVNSTTGNFMCNIKEKSSLLSQSRCYRLRPLMTALQVKVLIVYRALIASRKDNPSACISLEHFPLFTNMLARQLGLP